MQEFRLEFNGPDERRLDHFLAQALPEFSRSRLQQLIRQGLVRVGDREARKSGELLEAGSVVTVTIPAAVPTSLAAEAIDLDLIFENDDVIVVNKPAGMVVHPAAGHAGGTLVNAILAHDGALRGVGGEERPGVVHRLDKDTSGLIVVAKHDAALSWLQEQFQERRVIKTYLALVDGHPPTASGRIEAPIGRDPSLRKKMSIRPEGKGRDAVTEYTTREDFSQHTLLQVRPHTGRTHQIRLHLALVGCPVAGDRVYGRRRSTVDLQRHFLHAWRLQLVLPNETEPREFVAPLPPQLEAVLVALRARATQGA